jgi:hypothetical protein
MPLAHTPMRPVAVSDRLGAYATVPSFVSPTRRFAETPLRRLTGDKFLRR